MYQHTNVFVVLFGTRPNEKISNLFPQRDRKRIASLGLCIVGFVGPGRMETGGSEKRQTWNLPWPIVDAHLTGADK